MNNHIAAIGDYDRALRLNPGSYSALAGRAGSQLSLGQLDEAQQDLLKALELNPPAGDREQIEDFLQYVKSQGE